MIYKFFKKFYESLPRVILIILVSGTLLGYFYFNSEYFSPQFISENYKRIKYLSDTNFLFAIIVYTVLYLLSTALSLPIATLLSLLGGSLFGWIAIPTIMISATLGATIIVIATKGVFSNYFTNKLENKYDFIKNNLKRDSFHYLLFIRLVPIAPFFIINIVSGLLNLNVLTFMSATFLGIMPATCIYVWIGSSVGNVLNDGIIPDISNLVLYFFPPLFLLALLSLSPIFVRRFK